MKALTLTQPWASLVACGAKKVETRSWGTSYRGPLAIHAAKGFPAAARVFARTLHAEGIIDKWESLPVGMIVATCRLHDVLREDGSILWPGQEQRFGDLSLGRYAWILHEIEPIAPLPARGSLGLWEWAGAFPAERLLPSPALIACPSCNGTGQRGIACCSTCRGFGKVQGSPALAVRTQAAT